MHKYYMDFWIKLREKNGVITEKLIEVKPEKETRPPKRGKNPKAYTKAMYTWTKNKSKWKAAAKYAARLNMKFHILTEKQIIPQLGKPIQHKSVKRSLIAKKRNTIRK